ncbi:MAG: methyltransferase domain-containing protein [Candidatus Tectomicrobia bacterium]|nr:methyltransferase domain-containing protein [Candidatus Tectomicrobia bacterium]
MTEDFLRESAIRRLNWGCGPDPASGWINSDRRKDDPRVEICCDIREGLPLEDESIDYISSMHALNEVPYPELIVVLRELLRILKVGGVLRLGLPDLDKGIKAYLRGDRDYFLIPDEDMKSLGGKFILQMIWYGYSKTLFTYDFIEEILAKAGFTRVNQCNYRETRSRYLEITELDNREQETLFVEATK